MKTRFTLAAAAMIAMTAFAATPAKADNGIGFGFYFGTPGFGGPTVVAPNHGRPQARPAFVPSRTIARDVQRQGCNVGSVNQRGDRYVVRANCGRRGVPVTFTYNARNGNLISTDVRGGGRRW